MVCRAGLVDAPGNGGLQQAAQQVVKQQQAAQQQAALQQAVQQQQQQQQQQQAAQQVVVQQQAAQQQAAQQRVAQLHAAQQRAALQRAELQKERCRAIVPWSNPITLDTAREEEQALMVRDRRFAAQQREEREARALEQTPPRGAAQKQATRLFGYVCLMLFGYAFGAACGMVLSLLY